jgi:hypothetical protein
LSINIRAYSGAWQKYIEPLEPGEKLEIPKIHLPLHYELLEGHMGRKKVDLEIKINEEIVETEKVPLLGFYEWPTAPAFRRSLACFVQPAHPIIQNILLDASTYLKDSEQNSSFIHLLKSDRKDKIDLAMKAIYNCLKEKYEIQYVLPPSSVETEYQDIRPPHRIMTNTMARIGAGTCLDTTLLFASCLENLYLQPFIVFVKKKNGQGNFFQHTFIGCWRDVTERFVPIYLDYQELGEFIVLETAGFTDWYQTKLSYEDAIREAEDQLLKDEFLFALDIAAIRQTVAPLQFPMIPEVIGIIRKAEELALEEKSDRLETKHLLFSLMLHKDEINDELEQEGIHVNSVQSIISEFISPNEEGDDAVPRPTINYRRVIEDAKIISSDIGIKYIEKEHLWYAILLSLSENVDHIFKTMGTNRKEVKTLFNCKLDWSRQIVQTVYEK